MADEPRDRRSARWVPGVVTGLAAVAVAGHLVWPGLKIDAVTVALLALGVLPWLRGIVKSIELPGGASIELRERKVLSQEGSETIDAVRQVGTAHEPQETDERLRAVAELGEEYERLRDTQPSGDTRTRAMNRLAYRLLALLPIGPEFDTEEELRSHRSGRRLAGYLSLVADPRPELTEPLIRTLTEREGIPFNQSWALRALSLLVDSGGVRHLDEGSIARLAGMRDGLRPGLDRQVVLADLVDRLA